MLTAAIKQVPTSHRRQLLVRADGAGATHDLLDWLTTLNQARGPQVEYSVGFPTHKGIAVHDAIHTVPESAWQTAVATDGEPATEPGSWRSRGCST